MKILLRRIAALGDVILTTPVLRRLRRENPDAEIEVHTFYADVFRNTGVQLRTFPETVNDRDYDRVIDLTNAYELKPNTHIVEAYMHVAFDDPGPEDDWLPEMHPGMSTRMPPNAVAVHAAVAGWRSRTLPRATWVKVVHGLRDAGYLPVMVGLARDALSAAATSFHATDLMAQAALIGACRAFVGSDSGLLHVAAAMKTPHVGVFTCTDPHLRLPRAGVPCCAVVADIACAGCLHRREPPVTDEFCVRGDLACVSAVRAEEIVEAVLEMMKNG